MLSPDSPIISSQERDGNTRYCDNCREIRLDGDLTQKVEGMRKIYGRRICSLKYTQTVSPCNLCDVFRERTRQYETHTPVLSAASPKHWLTAPLPRVPESGVLLFVGYNSKGWHADDSQVLVMVDDTFVGISGREYSIDRIDFGIIKGLLSYCRENHTLCATMSTHSYSGFASHRLRVWADRLAPWKSSLHCTQLCLGIHGGQRNRSEGISFV